MLVLLADDNQDMRDIVASILRTRGFDVLEACDGEEAFALLHAHPIDAIISDVQMPRMGGEQLLELVRERRPSLPVFLMTGGATLTLEKARSLGAAWLFFKPDLEGLFSALEEMVPRAACGL